MNFQNEQEALQKIYAGLDAACKNGSFGLTEAHGLMNNVNTLGEFLVSGLPTLVSKMAMPRDTEMQAETENDETIPVPGTKHRVAKEN